MFAFMGITGRVGGDAARLVKGVRAIVREPARAPAWVDEVAQADAFDSEALTRAFRGAEGVFVMSPPNWAPSPGYPEMHALVRSVARAVKDAAPGKLVLLSSIGAHRDRDLGLITSHWLMEQALDELDLPRAYLRAGWFMENASWDVPSAREGTLESYLTPLDQPVPMVATADIAQTVATLLGETWRGRRVVELGRPTSPNDVASGLSHAMGRTVVARAVPRSTWEARFQQQGTAWPQPRIEMLDGFNSGWIRFEGEPQLPPTSFDEVARSLI